MFLVSYFHTSFDSLAINLTIQINSENISFQLDNVLLVLVIFSHITWTVKGSSHCKQAVSREIIQPHSVAITEFGAVGDGVNLNTNAFQNAIFYLNSFSEKGGAKLFVPVGRWLTGSFDLISHLTLLVDKDAVILGYNVKSEKDDSEDVPNGVCEGPVTRENPLFWNGEADRGVADEDVGLVHRDVSSSEQLRELGFMETQRALPPVPGLQALPARIAESPFLPLVLQVAAEIGKSVKGPSAYEVTGVHLDEEYKEIQEWVNGFKPIGKERVPEVLSLKKSIDASSVTSRTTEYYFGIMDEIVDEIGEEYIVQVVTNNEAAVKAGGQMYTKCVELLRPGITRFATKFIALESIVRSKQALKEMVTSSEWKRSTYPRRPAGQDMMKVINSNQFWEKVAKGEDINDISHEESVQLLTSSSADGDGGDDDIDDEVFRYSFVAGPGLFEINRRDSADRTHRRMIEHFHDYGIKSGWDEYGIPFAHRSTNIMIHRKIARIMSRQSASSSCFFCAPLPELSFLQLKHPHLTQIHMLEELRWFDRMMESTGAYIDSNIYAL
ncbi:hypothetical protein V6N12_066477 [Hibiscus sabdariffa]|uniref:Uncharacterized protein n=1 Tax=Hibiscus sabdariffa TaxID=183260 RepID=A0ABR2CQ82_9ROSI